MSGWFVLAARTGVAPSLVAGWQDASAASGDYAFPAPRIRSVGLSARLPWGAPQPSPDGAAFFAEITATGAMLLARAKSTRKPLVLAHLADGSYMSRPAGTHG